MPPQPAANARVILLGASNLTRGVSPVIGIAQHMFGSPLQVFAALGHGRSYGMTSTVLGRTLPGILQCGLWDALAEQPNPPEAQQASTAALITDIGNDIMYGALPETIADWVDGCIARLRPHAARIGMTMLPIESIRAVQPWQYAIVKNIMFPTRRITFEQTMTRAEELHERLIDLAQRRAVNFVSPLPDWYGFDPIHIRRRCWPQAWTHILRGCWQGAPAPDPQVSISPRRWLRLRTATPQHWKLFAMAFHTRQPAARLPSGTAVSLY